MATRYKILSARELKTDLTDNSDSFIASQKAVKTAVDAKQATLVSGTNIKTINSTSLLGSGDIAISGSVADGDKGDITVSGTGATWTIDNKAVSLAKMADLAQNTIIGRVTASTGVPEALTAANVRTIINVADGATANAKATGAEINTGTDDVKFATAKAIADSDIFRAGKSAQISALTDKATPVDADVTMIEDSAATNAKKKLTWSNIKATLKTYFDTVYQAALVSGTNIKTINSTTLLGSGDIAITVPVKATGAEVDTGTDDAKFVTAKAVADSKLSYTDGTETLTNKRVTPRITSITSHATPSINTDNCDCVTITAQAEAITSMTTNLSGTPTNFQKLIIRIKDNGTARAITWGTSFEAKGVALPTTTVVSKVLTVGFIYDTVTSKWGCVASAQEA